jgi:hypothetical protein
LLRSRCSKQPEGCPIGDSCSLFCRGGKRSLLPETPESTAMNLPFSIRILSARSCTTNPHFGIDSIAEFAVASQPVALRCTEKFSPHFQSLGKGCFRTSL